ncbi:MAG: NIPSNAP family protein [Chloroflexi bacterium]|nr:NIPSNAP family protein [Chloroflexota bacterium]
MITELRRYRIKPGRLESWLAIFQEAIREHEPHGIRVEYAGVDRETSTFVWLRSFADEADRVARKDAFYGADWWLERESLVMDHVLEYSVTFLDAALIRDGEQIVSAPWPAAGEAAGSHADGPPDGWVRSSRATFVPETPPG